MRAAERVGASPEFAEVELWFAALDQVPADESERFRSWFTAAEAEQFSHFLSERRKREFIIGRGLARVALSSRFGVEPQHVEFSADARGKLTVQVPEAARSTHFSISHTHDIVVVALCPAYPVGVDVERFVDRLDPLTLAERFYSESEHEVLTKLQGASQRDRFYVMWTLKEALGKAHGLGVLPGTNTTHFDIAEETSLHFDIAEEISLVALCWETHFSEAWLAAAKPSERHRLALCVLCGNDVPVRVRVKRNQTSLSDLSDLTWVEGRLRNRQIRDLETKDSSA